MFDWNDEMRKDLYTGTAKYYHEFRVPYSSKLIDDLRARANLTGSGKLLDLGCGTGQLAFLMHKDFEEIWAVDKEEGMIEFGRSMAEGRGIRNIRWIAERAELLEVESDLFQLVGIANAFHRLGRRGAAKLAFRCLRPGNCLALIGCATPASIRRSPGDSGWRLVLAEAVGKWIAKANTSDRFPKDAKDLEEVTDSMILDEAGFDYLGEFHFPASHFWTVDTILGLFRGTSYLSQYSLGSKHDEFENELRNKFLACEDSGVFPDTLDFHYQLARRPE